MIEFAYNHIKNVSISHILFKLNCKYYSYIFYKNDFNLYLNSKTAKKQFFKLQNFMAIYQQNPHHTQELQNQTYNKKVKF